VTIAVAKSPLSLTSTIIELQRANQTAILSLANGQDGVQTMLHAAMLVLQRHQNARLRAACMLSKMGDGSSDRKTTEQVGYPNPNSPSP
jgi:hypothetical protein